MPHIVPIRDLKNTNEIFKLVQEADEPVFVTKNGYGAFVMMSMEHFDKAMAKNYIRAMLKEAEDELASGAKPLDGEAVMKELMEFYLK